MTTTTISTITSIIASTISAPAESATSTAVTSTPTVLLVDIGNSHIKWHSQNVLDTFNLVRTPESLSQDDSNWQNELKQKWTNLPAPNTCIISNVNTEATLETVEHLIHTLFGHTTPIQRITPQKQHGTFSLAYDNPNQMGSDRYAQLLGAQTLSAAQNHLVISAGTATTIDGILANGIHIGGVIIPSPHLMRTSLHQHTARLPLSGGDLTLTPPSNTLDALASGARLATKGAVTAFMQEYMPSTPAHWLLCGGGAMQLASDLTSAAKEHQATIQIIPSLCLLGMWQFVNDEVT